MESEASYITDEFATDDDFFSNLAASVETVDVSTDVEVSEAKQAQMEKLAERERVIEQLVDYYGDEIIYYGTYTGTIAVVAEACPAFQYVLTQGFDAALSWIEANRKEKPEEREETEKKEIEALDESKGDEKKSSHGVEDKGIVALEIEKATLDNKMNEVSIKKDGAGSVEAKPLPKEVKSFEADDMPTQPEASLMASVDIQEASSTIAVNGELAQTVVGATSDHSIEKPDETVEIPDYIEEEPIAKQPSEVETVLEKVLDEEIHDVELETDSISVGELDLLKNEVNPQDETDLSIYVQEAGFANVDSGEVSEVLQQDQKDDVIFEERAESPPMYEYFSNWHELAIQETPFETLVVEVIEALETELASTPSESTEDDVEALRFQTELSTSEDAEKYVEVSDEVLKAEAPLELYGMLVTVTSARQTVEKLYAATTKEECATYIEQLSAELSELLRGLGYENPELIIKAFLAQHSPQALYSLVHELEVVLRKVAQSRVALHRAQQLHGAHYRKRRVGKVTGFVMRALMGYFKPSLSVDPVY